MRRYPIEPLLEATGWTLSQAAQHLGIGGPEYRRYADEGMSRDVAERKALKAGFHPYEVWPDMADDDHEDAIDEKRRRAREAQRRYRERHPDYRERGREYRRSYYADHGEYERARQREYDRQRRREVEGRRLVDENAAIHTESTPRSTKKSDPSTSTPQAVERTVST